MPVPLEPAERKFLILAGSVLLAVLVLALILAPPAEQQPTGYASSYSAGSDGAKAAFLLLRDLGYAVEHWEKPPTQLPTEPGSTVLILSQPLLPSAADESQAIRAFIRKGGHVLATGPIAARLLPEGGTLEHEPQGTGWATYRAVVPSPLARGAPEITMARAVRWQMAHFGHLAIYAEGVNSVVVSYSYGKGQVVWWAAATPLSNAGIRQTGNLNLFLNSVGPPGERRVLWDEYFHGRRGSLWTYFAGTPISWGLAQLGLFAVALLLTFARRSGPVRPPVPESRLSPLEFVETLGDLYHRAHAAGAAVGIANQRFRYLLTRRLGLPSTAPTAQLFEAVRDRLGWKQPGFYETLQRAERAARDPALDDAAALQVVQALEQYAELLQLRPRNPEEHRGWRNK